MSFSKNFLWGAASAAHQIEGAYLEDEKGPGIWDSLTQEPGHIAHGENGNIACDHYHHCKEDIALMKTGKSPYFHGMEHYTRCIILGMPFLF